MTTLTTAQPPPDAPGRGAEIKAGGPSSVPGPLLFIGRAVRTIWSNGKARSGMVILGFFILLSLFAPLIAPHSPTATTFKPYLGPSGTNWFGTTGNGEDVFSQFLYGGRVSLLVGLVSGFGGHAHRRHARADLGLPAGRRRQRAELRHQPGAGDSGHAADDHPGRLLLVALDLDDRAGRRGHGVGHRRTGDPQPGGHAAHPRLRDVCAVLAASGCSASSSARSCRT